MMNLNRDWQTADTLQGRDWQVSDVLQGRGWQTDDMTTARGWQEADYTKALADQRADAQTGRGWDLADASADASAQAAAALAAQPDMSLVLNRMRAEFPDVPDQLYSVAMHIKDMDHNPPMGEPHQEDIGWEPPDGWRGETKQIDIVENGVVVPKLYVTDQVGESQAEVYLKSLTEGAILSVDPVDGSTQRTPALSAEDAGTLRAMIDYGLSFDSQSKMMKNFETMSEDDFLRWSLNNPMGPLDAASYGGTPTYGGTSQIRSNVNQYRPSGVTTAPGPDSAMAAMEEWWTENVPGGNYFNPAGVNLSPMAVGTWLASVLGDKVVRDKTGK
jgi:hypothetical protein